MRSFSLIIVLILLTACAMGPDYKRPKVPVPEDYRMAAAEKEAQSIANLPWWQLLDDEELQKLVRIALVENKDLKQAVATVEEFQALLGVARTDFIPQVSVSANYSPKFARLHPVDIARLPSSSNNYVQ